jgi:hypothetical protein
MDIDNTLTEAEAVGGMLELISLCPNAGRIILAHSLLYIMGSVYAGAWKFPCCCIFLYGDTGDKKTNYSAFTTQIHNRGKGVENPQRLNASISAALALVLEKSDCIVVLDDLFPAKSKSVRQKQEETLLEITRVIADGTIPARMRGNKVVKASPTCGVIFTAEYLVGTGSNAARLLPVEMTPFDHECMQKFQDKPLMVSTFYHGFIKWFLSNYYDIRDLLKEWLNNYREVRIGVHDRLQETHFFLNTAYALFLQYCCDKCFLSEQDARVLHRSFLNLLTSLVLAQQERVQQGKVSETERIDFLARIRTSYKNGEILLADDARQFKKELGHEGVIHNNELCLRSDKLRLLFPGILVDDIAKGLLSQGALRPGTEKLQIQLYATGNLRFYAIPLNKMM